MALQTETSLRVLTLIRDRLLSRSLYLNDWELRSTGCSTPSHGVDIHFHREGSEELHLLQVEWSEPEDEINTRVTVIASVPHLVPEHVSRNYSNLNLSIRKAMEVLLHQVYLKWNKAP